MAQGATQYSNTFNHVLDSIDRLIGGRFPIAKHKLDTVLIDELVDYVSKERTDIKAHFLLMMLCLDYPDRYQLLEDSIKCEVFCFSFSHMYSMDYWGSLAIEPNGRSKEGIAGIMLTRLGKQMVPCLYTSLRDTTLLQYGWSFETRALPKMYKWRRKDFAYRYAALILGEKPIFLKDPHDRDKVIEDFIEKYEKEMVKKK